ncbi:Salmonella virulence plasmid 28.1kDa A protein [Enterobacter cancerogenus]|uniref:Salmonella virulence plasmid 28.1kDa A protein n=1 Tax=Enterobacter cancerogenus TaxID=69218 RepID=A0A484WVQ2_9ENTR|nr:Salmonella virulence plasmid 28.1kDa A protein [Enterobacter cancerogenus]
MPTYNLSSGTVSEYVTTLKKAGYDSVFDIIAKSRADFIKSVPDMEDSRARQTYHQARDRAHVLKSLYRSWQLRQEPVIGRLKKLAPSPSPLLKDTLLRNIGGDGDFSDLMERSTDYADAASIQSLFSPGRYAVALYKVAKAFHEEGSALDIDTRRPDLKDLILSETTMNQEITSLDLLLEMLQGNDSNKLNALSTSFFPMTLPYDDRLTQISAALDAQGRTLNGIWDSLSDTLASSFAADGQLTRSTPFSEEVSGRKIFLKTDDKMVFLAHATAGGAHLPGAHLNAGKPDAEAVLVAPLHITRKDGLFYLGIEGDITLNNISLSGCYLMADSGEDNGNEGNYARMGNTGAHLNPTTYLPITLEPDGGNGTWLKTSKGYIGIGSSGAIDWPTPLTVAEPSTATALSFSFCSDESGNNPVSPDASLPPNTAPNPPARTILNLTPVSYQLMANEELTETDIISHYGLENSQQRSVGDLATQLNDIPTFCEKTGLTFNQLLDLTAQFSYARAGGKKGTANHPMSHFKKYGATYTADVDEYGAAFINSGVDKNIEDIFLWVQPEQRDAAGNITTAAALNFYG